MMVTPAQGLETQVVDALKTVYDPEIPVNIYDLGLIYQVDIQAEGHVRIRMTLTSPMCPVAGILPGQVESAVQRVPGVTKAAVELVWEPVWTKDLMTDEAKLQLNLF